MKIESLKSNGVYYFRHKRKGLFYARFVELVSNYEDERDPLLVRVDIWTQEGSGQERLANALEYIGGTKQHPVLSERLLRPSLLTMIESPSTSEQTRLTKAMQEQPRPIRAEEVEADYPGYVGEEKPKRSWFDRLLRRNK